MQEDFKKMKDNQLASLNAMLDQCDIGCDAVFDAKMILDSMNEMEKSIFEKLKTSVKNCAMDDNAIVSAHDAGAGAAGKPGDGIYTQLRVQECKSKLSVYNFLLPRAVESKKFQRISSSLQ